MDFLKNVVRGQTIYRILFQQVLFRNRHHISGKVLDLGAGSSPSYYRYLDTLGGEFIKTDYVLKPGVDRMVDFNKPFPFAEETFDTVCIFHALYVAEDPPKVLKEVHRVLKKGGTCILAMPFVANEMPEPHDYHRFTLEGLEFLLREIGFEPVTHERIGERFTAAVYVLNPFFRFWPIKLVAYSTALFFDKLIPRKLKQNYPFPIGYLYVARK